MKICIVLPEWSKKMRWFQVYKDLFSKAGLEVLATNDPTKAPPCDLYLYTWADEVLQITLPLLPPQAKVVVILRRYEFYMGHWLRVDWKRVDKLICLNPYFQEQIKQFIGVNAALIPNGVNLDTWSYKQRWHGTRIAMVGFINGKKNLPLAMQILLALPSQFSLHLAGDIQDGVVMNYVDYVAKKNSRKVYHYGQVEDLNLWLDGMNYLLSPSITEGCPNNVIEAMAKGLKPLIHAWPGSDLFPPELIFHTVQDAVKCLDANSPYESQKYRDFIVENHAETPYKKVLEIVTDLLGAKV